MKRLFCLLVLVVFAFAPSAIAGQGRRVILPDNNPIIVECPMENPVAVAPEYQTPNGKVTSTYTVVKVMNPNSWPVAIMEWRKTVVPVLPPGVTVCVWRRMQVGEEDGGDWLFHFNAVLTLPNGNTRIVWSPRFSLSPLDYRRLSPPRLYDWKVSFPKN